jgi:hypothetical protein
LIEELIDDPFSVPFNDAPAAVLDTGEYFQEAFSRGIELFVDRDYALLDPPSELDGKTFVCVPIGGASYQCVQAGMVWVVTPSAGRNADSLEPQLLADGFEKTDLSEFYLFNQNNANLCSVFQKQLEMGENLAIGKWGVLVF